MPDQVSEVTALVVEGGSLFFGTSGAYARVGRVSSSGVYSVLALVTGPVHHLEPHGQILVYDVDDGFAQRLEVIDQKTATGIANFPLIDLVRWTSDGVRIFAASAHLGTTTWDAGASDADASTITDASDDVDAEDGASDADDSGDAGDADSADDAAGASQYARLSFADISSSGGWKTFWEEPGRITAMTMSDGDLLCAFAGPGRLIRFPSAALVPTVLATGAFDASALRVGASEVYLADSLGMRILRVPLSGGSLETVLPLSRAAHDVWLDGGTTWVALSSPAELWEHGASGPRLLAGLLSAHAPIAVDATHVYWSSPGVGVLRLPR